MNVTPKMVSGLVVNILTPPDSHRDSKGEGAESGLDDVEFLKSEIWVEYNSVFIFSKTFEISNFTSSFVNRITLYPKLFKTLVLIRSSSICSSELWYSPSTSIMSFFERQTKSTIKSSIRCCCLNLSSKFLLRNCSQSNFSNSVGFALIS